MSTNTFVYKNVKEWKSDIEEMLPEAIRWEFIEKIKEYIGYEGENSELSTAKDNIQEVAT